MKGLHDGIRREGTRGAIIHRHYGPTSEVEGGRLPPMFLLLNVGDFAFKPRKRLGILHGDLVLAHGHAIRIESAQDDDADRNLPPWQRDGPGEHNIHLGSQLPGHFAGYANGSGGDGKDDRVG
jgi:hypothetical protein